MKSAAHPLHPLGWLSARFELARDGAGSNILAMEGVRGFAVLLVFLVHVGWFLRPWVHTGSDLAAMFSLLTRLGHAGVDIFFLLSGYLIYGSLVARKQGFARFMQKRVRRLYPAFLIVLFVYVVSDLTKGASREIPAGLGPALRYLITNLLLLPGILPIHPLITVAWSLSYEMLFYVTCAAMVNGLNMHSWSRAYRVGFLLGLLGAGIVAFLAWGGPIRFGMFVFGGQLHEISDCRPFRAVPQWLALGCLALGIASLLYHGTPAAGAASMVALGVGGLVFFGTMLDVPQQWLARVFQWTPLRWLGNMSYSYYLVHSMALSLCTVILARLLVPEQAFTWAILPLFITMFATTLVVSAILFLSVERPLSLLRRNAAEVSS